MTKKAPIYKIINRWIINYLQRKKC